MIYCERKQTIYFAIYHYWQQFHAVIGGARWSVQSANPTNPIHHVSEKTSTHIIGYKLRNSCLILIIFGIKIPHII